MRKLILISCAVVLALGAMAQEFETIFTTKGEKYIGYISEQVPGVSVSVYAVDADLVLARTDVKNLREEYRNVHNLPTKVKTYLGDVEEEYIKLYSFTYNNQVWDDMIPVKMALDSIHLKSLTARTYQLAWNTITRVEKLQADADDTPVLDVITLKTGEQHEGKVLFQIMGDKMVLRNTEGEVHHIPISTIASISLMCEDSIDLDANTALLDRVYLTDGTVLKGIITSRVMGKEISIISEKSNKKTTIALKDIVRYQKTQNNRYKPTIKAEDTIAPRVVSINNQELTPDTITREGNVCFVKERVVLYEKKGGDMIIKSTLIPDGKVYVYTLKENKDGKPSLPYFESTLTAEMIMECIQNTEENTSSIHLTINKKGKYVLLLDEPKIAKTGIIINIE